MDINLKHYQRLPLYSFWIFILRNSLVAISGLLIFLMVLVIKVSGITNIFQVQTSDTTDLASSIDVLLNWAILGGLALFFIGFFISFILATIDYFSFKCCLDDNDIRIRRGILNIQEGSIPYHTIENVSIDRPLIYQIVGASTLVIYTAAATHLGTEGYRESEGTFPAMPKRLAEELREELLRRAHEGSTHIS